MHVHLRSGLTVGRWPAAAFSIENLCEVRINELHASSLMNFPFHNKAPLLRARAKLASTQVCMRLQLVS
jgi:hypothetical protein